MEKVFEEKQFHGTVKFFTEVSVWDKAFNQVILREDVGRAFQSINILSTDAPVTGHKIGAWIQAGINRVLSTVWASWQVLSGLDIELSLQSGETITNVFGTRLTFTSGTNDGFTVTNFSGMGNFWWGNGIGTVTNWKTYNSDLSTKPSNLTLTNAWHFYGKGAYPSYFGGDVQVAGRINNPEVNVASSTPPTQAEMVSGFGVASGTSGNWYIMKNSANIRYIVFSDGTNYHYNAFTVGA
jgi:hypothetical protein